MERSLVMLAKAGIQDTERLDSRSPIAVGDRLHGNERIRDAVRLGHLGDHGAVTHER
jgi:hypothetical protein